MAILRKNAQKITILEQQITDLITGLTLQFSLNKHDGTAKLTLYGDILPFGNRDIIFDTTGREGGGGTALTDICDFDGEE